MAGRLVEFAGWLATHVFDVVAGVQGADGGATVDLQVGKTVFYDVPAKMRAELWLSQLARKESGGATAGEYYDLLFEELSPDVLAEIDKDTHRTFPGHTRLASLAGQKAMLNVLRAYALSDPEIGYTQGMNFLAGLLLTYLPSEADAYGVLSLLMHQRGLREMYLPDMSLLQIRLWQLSKLLPPRLAAHLEAHAALPVLYASSWLLTCFAADFPLHFGARVVDVLMTGQAAASPMLKVAVGIVSSCEAALFKMDDFEDMVNYLRQEVPQWPKSKLHDLLTDALSKPWSPRQLRVLDQINGAETVMEAVARVNKLASQGTTESAEVLAALEGTASSPVPPVEPELVPGAAQPQSSQQPVAAAGSEQQQQQLTPRAVARSLSNVHLPKPQKSLSAKAAAATWASWKGVPDLESLPSMRVHIDRSIGDLVQLDPQLSQALSVYSPHDGSRCASIVTAAQGSPVGCLPAMTERPQHQRGDGQQAVSSPCAEETHARWEAFAHQSSIHLISAPSPFAFPAASSGLPAKLPPSSPQQQQQQQQQPVSPAAPAGSAPTPAAATRSAAPAQWRQQDERAAAASGAAAAEASEGTGPSPAPSYGSFQLGTLNSAQPLMDLTEQWDVRQPKAGEDGDAQGSGSSAKKLQSFLSLFGRVSDGSKQGSQQAGSPDDAPRAYSSGSSSLIQDAPSSHGSSLAAVLHALSLNANTASTLSPMSVYEAASSGGTTVPGSTVGTAAAPSSDAACTGNRWLRHSSEAEEWSSFKTATGSDHGCDGHSSGGLGLSSVGSWQSTGLYGRQASGLFSNGSSSMGHLQPRYSATGLHSSGSSLGLGPVRHLSAAVSSVSAEPQHSQRLSSEAATQRVMSLQEEHLQGFLASGKRDAVAKER